MFSWLYRWWWRNDDEEDEECEDGDDEVNLAARLGIFYIQVNVLVQD